MNRCMGSPRHCSCGTMRNIISHNSNRKCSGVSGRYSSSSSRGLGGVLGRRRGVDSLLQWLLEKSRAGGRCKGDRKRSSRPGKVSKESRGIDREDWMPSCWGDRWLRSVLGGRLRDAMRRLFNQRLSVQPYSHCIQLVHN